MVFGYLLGGMVKSIGAQMQEEKHRQHQEDIDRHNMAYDMTMKMLHERGGDITPEELQHTMANLDLAVGNKKPVFASLVPFTQQVIPHLTPPDRVTPPSEGGGVKTAGQAPPESIMAQPSGVGEMPPMPERPTSQLNAQMTPEGQSAVPPMPQMPTRLSGTFNERKQQEALANIDASDMSPGAKEAAKAHILAGINIGAYEATMSRSGMAESAPPKVLGGQPFWIERDGETYPVSNTTKGPMLSDAQGHLTPYVHQAGDKHSTPAGAKPGWKLQDTENGLTWMKPPDTEGGQPTAVATGIKAAPKGNNIDILTPEAKEMLSNAIASGNYEAVTAVLGRTTGPVRQEIANMAAANFKGLSVAEQRAKFKSLSGALDKITAMKTNVESFEATALDNLDVYEQQISKVADSGVAWFNKPLRDVERGGLSAPEQTAYDAAREVAVNEMSKIFSSANLQGGVVSDDMRKHVEALLPANATAAQAYEAIRVLKTDMANRLKELNRSVYNTQQLIKALPGETPKLAPREGAKAEEKGGGKSVKVEVAAPPTKWPATIAIMNGTKLVGTRPVKSEQEFHTAQEWADKKGYTIEVK